MFRSIAEDAAQTRVWFDSNAATAWHRQEAALLYELLPRLTGFRCLQLGAGPLDEATRARLGTLRFWWADVRVGPGVDMCFDGRHLPWASGSVDALILSHALELSDEPHALIRECVRVLSPRGQLICLAFNPLSPWAIWQSTRSRGNRFVPYSMPPRAARLADWLRVLDFETVECWRYGPGFPLFGQAWNRHDGQRALVPAAWAAGGYALIARRRALRRIPPSNRGVLAKTGPRRLARNCSSRLSSRS